jgi:diguanylate cyclase (GGDEF)-like protein/PAS domain S-box-containing protein
MVTGSDELSSVAVAINGMLTAQAAANEATRASEEKFRKLAETSAAAIFIAQDAQVRYANSRAEALTGYGPTEMLSMPFQSVVPAAVQSQISTTPAGRSADAPGQYEVQIVNPRGPARWLEVTAGPIEFEGGPATIATAYDITERKHAQEGMAAANAQLTGLVAELERRNTETDRLSQMTDLLQACPTPEESYAVIAQFFKQLFPGAACALYLYRASRDKLETVATSGDFPLDLNQNMFTPDACWALRIGHAHSMTGPGAGLRCAHVPVAPAGGYLCVPVVARGDALGVLHLRFDTLAVTPPQTLAGLQADWLRLAEMVGERLALALANVNLREALRHQAVRDPLTGLFNRRYLQETLEREISRAARANRPVSVLFMDVDHFKRFNDTHGHDAGDALLREVGLTIKRNLRAEDIACRYGGEEILLIMPDSTLEVAQQRAEQIRAAIAALRVKHYDQMLGAITISVGLAAYPTHGATGDIVIRAADQALYQAKQTGRDRVCLATAAA